MSHDERQAGGVGGAKLDIKAPSFAKSDGFREAQPILRAMPRREGAKDPRAGRGVRMDDIKEPGRHRAINLERRRLSVGELASRQALRSSDVR